jgi:hypothetical protein
MYGRSRIASAGTVQDGARFLQNEESKEKDAGETRDAPSVMLWSSPPTKTLRVMLNECTRQGKCGHCPEKGHSTELFRGKLIGFSSTGKRKSKEGPRALSPGLQTGSTESRDHSSSHAPFLTLIRRYGIIVFSTALHVRKPMDFIKHRKIETGKNSVKSGLL